MNAEFLAGCSGRNAGGSLVAKEAGGVQNDSEAGSKRKNIKTFADCFMGAATTADALVLLSRRLTYSVKIPGISFHKGVESWLCTWKEPDSR